MTVEPKFLKGLVSKAMTKDSQALSFALDLFDQEELSAYKTTTRRCLIKSVKQLMEEMGQDFAKLDTNALQVW